MAGDIAIGVIAAIWFLAAVESIVNLITGWDISFWK